MSLQHLFSWQSNFRSIRHSAARLLQRRILLLLLFFLMKRVKRTKWVKANLIGKFYIYYNCVKYWYMNLSIVRLWKRLNLAFVDEILQFFLQGYSLGVVLAHPYSPSSGTKFHHSTQKNMETKRYRRSTYENRRMISDNTQKKPQDRLPRCPSNRIRSLNSICWALARLVHVTQFTYIHNNAFRGTCLYFFLQKCIHICRVG